MPEKLDWLRQNDLGLSYEAALHGVQCSIAFGFYERSMEPKHMRTGVDMSKVDALGLACLLIDKGLIGGVEYAEYLRLAANLEVVNRQEEAKHQTGKEIIFR